MWNISARFKYILINLYSIAFYYCNFLSLGLELIVPKRSDLFDSVTSQKVNIDGDKCVVPHVHRVFHNIAKINVELVTSKWSHLLHFTFIIMPGNFFLS